MVAQHLTAELFTSQSVGVLIASPISETISLSVNTDLYSTIRVDVLYFDKLFHFLQF